MNMTYKELQKQINTMTDEEKDMNVSVYVSGIDEFYPIDVISFSTSENDVFDKGQPILNAVE